MRPPTADWRSSSRAEAARHARFTTCRCLRDDAFPVGSRARAIRQAWAEQLPLTLDYERVTPRLDRFQGAWQDGDSRSGYFGYSPPALTLSELRAWCADQHVTRCYVDALAEDPDPHAPDDRYVLIGDDPAFDALDEAALLGRSLRWSDVPLRSWLLEVRSDLPVALYEAVKPELRATLADVPTCRGVRFDDATARIYGRVALDAPTEHVVVSIAHQLLKWTLTSRPDGRLDEAGNGFGVSVERMHEAST